MIIFTYILSFLCFHIIVPALARPVVLLSGPPAYNYEIKYITFEWSVAAGNPDKMDLRVR